jgi:hypothetical protein
MMPSVFADVRVSQVSLDGGESDVVAVDHMFSTNPDRKALVRNNRGLISQGL